MHEYEVLIISRVKMHATNAAAAREHAKRMQIIGHGYNSRRPGTLGRSGYLHSHCEARDTETTVKIRRK